MIMTTNGTERPAVMPVAAPVGAVGMGVRIAAPNPLQVHGTSAPLAQPQGIAVKPWITGYDRPLGLTFGREMTGRSARLLGRPST
jgi:hypothetical protein